MFSATDFLPWRMIEFMNLDTTTSPNFGSGLTSRLSALCRRDMFVLPLASMPKECPQNTNDPLLGSLCSVFRAPLLSVGHALRVEHAADDVVAHPREILDAAAADHHHRVLLQVMALARDVADHLKPVGEPYLGNLAQRRIGLLRRRCIDARAHTALLRTRLHVSCLLEVDFLHPRLADQLLYRRHLPHPPVRRRTAIKTVRQNPPPRRDVSPRLQFQRIRSDRRRDLADLGPKCPLLDDDSV